MLKGVGTSKQIDSLPFASSLCGVCYEVCPVRINIPEVLVHLREQVVDSHRGGVPGTLLTTMKGTSWLFSGGWRLGLLQKAAGLSARVLWKNGMIGRMPRPMSRWTDARDCPAPPRESFRGWWKRTDGGRNEAGSPRNTPGTGADRK
jgi:L-lactate dehydrogenase complex protein LldF